MSTRSPLLMAEITQEPVQRSLGSRRNDQTAAHDAFHLVGVT